MKLEVSMATPTRRQFTDAFKSEAVRLTQESGRPVAQVARELGIGDTLLYRWRSEQRQLKPRARRVSRCALGRMNWHGLSGKMRR